VGVDRALERGEHDGRGRRRIAVAPAGEERRGTLDDGALAGGDRAISVGSA
jgi:hypothetical protein